MTAAATTTAMLLTLATLAVLSAAAPSDVRLSARSPLHGQVVEGRLELVHVRHPSLRRAAAQAMPDHHPAHPARAELAFDALGATHTIALRRNDRLVGPDYGVFSLAADGAVLDVDRRRPACFYQGSVQGGGAAALSACGGVLDGSFDSAEHGRLVVEPAHRHVDGLSAEEALTAHVVFRAEDYKAERPAGWCGVTGHDHGHDHGVHAAAAAVRGRGRAASPMAVGDTLDVAVMVFNDKLRVDAYGDGLAADSLAMVNEAQAYYTAAFARDNFFDYDIQLAVAAQVRWTEEDPYDPAALPALANVTDASDLLAKFRGDVLANSTLTLGVDFDFGYLLTGRDVGRNNSASTVGLAITSSSCLGPADTSRAGLVETLAAFPRAFHSVTLAHELGHNFAMAHDTAGCLPSPAIMSSSSDPNSPPEAFSDCSKDAFNAHLASSSLIACLNTTSTPAPANLCGNGFVEDGEECDCGNSPCNCCDPATCQLLPGAVCSDREPCCDGTCNFRASSHVCRGAADSDCDLAETCSGTDATCPPDVFVGGGVSCGAGDRGACFAGRCAEPDEQCKAVNLGAGESFAGACPFSTAESFAGDYCAELSCVTAGNAGTSRCSKLTGSVTPWQNGVPCAGESDASRQCLDGVCTDAAAVGAAGAGSLTFKADLSAYGECNCSVQTREIERCSVVDAVTVSYGFAADETPFVGEAGTVLTAAGGLVEAVAASGSGRLYTENAAVASAVVATASVYARFELVARIAGSGGGTLELWANTTDANTAWTAPLNLNTSAAEQTRSLEVNALWTDAEAAAGGWAKGSAAPAWTELWATAGNLGRVGLSFNGTGPVQMDLLEFAVVRSQTVSTQACEPQALTDSCETDEEQPWCPGCGDDEYDLPSIGCQAKNNVYYAAGGLGALVLLCVCCSCCRSKKPKVSDDNMEMQRYNNSAKR